MKVVGCGHQGGGYLCSHSAHSGYRRAPEMYVMSKISAAKLALKLAQILHVASTTLASVINMFIRY